MTLQEEQTPIFKRLANALIEATPERWQFASLELVAPPGGLGTGLSHCITNPDFPRDFVTPTDELFEATRMLEVLSQRYKDAWTRCIFEIRHEDESWRFVVKFDR